MTTIPFERVFADATGGGEPYAYQALIAAEGMPEILAVPTGTGKTAAAVLPWLWRRRFHPDRQVRAATPHWLVLCLPMRVLTEQTERNVRGWLANLGLEKKVLVHVVMGGDASGGKELREQPERDAVLVGTLDMLLSRALNRGYGASRQSWPIDFGLLHNGCHWVFDEVQLMGPALETSRQLEGFRRRLGTVLPTSSTWMSATVSSERLRTVDNSGDLAMVGLSDDDTSGPLRDRLTATKTVRRLDLDPKDERRAAALAAALVAAHRPGTLTLAVHNTIKSARATHLALRTLGPPAEVHLLHSRFRPDDRALIEEAAIKVAADEAGPGRIVVTTQVLEAGVDVSAAVLFTEAAPWPSIVQRAGRCNRDGLVEGAQLLWSPPLKELPYEPDDVATTVAALVEMEGTAQTSTSLGTAAVATKPVFHPVLRRIDLLGLFDTTPDLSGNDIDIAPYIRPTDGMDVSVAWRDIGPDGPGIDDAAPRPREMCGAPLPEVRDLLKKQAGAVAWVVDHLRRDRDRDKKKKNDRWRQVSAEELRPGMVVVLAAAEAGCYTPTGGWDRTSRASVEPVADALEPEVNLVESADEADEDRLSRIGRWYPLTAHLDDVEREVRALAAELFHEASLPLAEAARPLVHAAAVAGRLHDIGKVHPIFQGTLDRTLADADKAPPGAGPWAKSGGSKNARHERRGFCHELASALALMAEGSVALDGEEEAHLIRYLVASHHGRVRMGIRALADERLPATASDGTPIPRDTRIARGIIDGELLPSVELPNGPPVPPSVLRLDPMELGRREPDGEPSWTERALVLRDRDDIGPFRLAWLEALVRLADWRASAKVMEGFR